MTNTKQFFQSLSRENAHDYFFKRLTYEAAPVLRGIKPATLVNAAQVKELGLQSWQQLTAYIIHEMGLSYRLLNLCGNRLGFLIYNKQALTQTLANTQTKHLLTRFGYYADAPIEDQLSRLAKRCKENGFPHEIGLFLGYPAKDVEAFIENSGKNCLLSGYWKVYHDEECARCIFAEIDQAKDHVACLLNEGMPCSMAMKTYRETVQA